MKKRFKVLGVFSAVLLLLLCAFAGYMSQAAPNGEALTGEVPESAAVLFFEPYGDSELFGYTDSTTHILSADGSRSCETAYPGQFGFVRGNTVSIVCLLDELTAVQRFDADTLTETDFFGLEGIGTDISLAECDAFGRVYAVPYSSPEEIFVFDAAGSYAGSLLYGEPVCGMQILDDTLLVLLSEHGERISLTEDFPQAGEGKFYYSKSARPYRMLDSETYVNAEGYVCALDGTALFDTGLNPLGERTTALSDSSVLWASDVSTVSKADLKDGTLSTHPVRGNLEAITQNSALTYRDGAFYRTAFGDFEIVPTPTPVPTETPQPSASPEPSPSAKPTARPTATPKPTEEPEPIELEFDGAFVAAPEGTTCARLKAGLAPSEVQVYTAGMSAASGRLRTGMLVSIDGELYTIFVRGDVSGSGAVNSADLRLLQRYLAGDEELDEAALRAADLNADGEVAAADLVLLAARIGG